MDESIRYTGENLGKNPSVATSKRFGSHPPSSIGGRRWSLRQVVHRLLDESSERRVTRRRKILPLVKWTSLIGRREGCLGLGGVGLWAQRGLLVVSSSRIFINWWRSLVSLPKLSRESFTLLLGAVCPFFPPLALPSGGKTISFLANISRMSTELPPPLQLPGLQGGLHPPAIREGNILPLPCLGLHPRSQDLALLSFLPAARLTSTPPPPPPRDLGLGR
ncbi:UNVERIFIED_CONTAM: hypothetical protein Sangu_1969000 [Sesamum angustifolium]|uniref:Uncharacterized protein n=1 Tax=Sesamum angustifolium TaxID=2727405 RepID=A0AAW2LXI5_9LAMI